MSLDDILEIELPESPIPPGTPQRMDEATVRRFGCVWRVHKNDPDPFPSRPHAHNLESGLKMHLGTGQLFLRGRDTGRKIEKKHLDVIRAELLRRGVRLVAGPTA
jgi:hypothetical protein